jgi:NADH:ubiquinone oxidoreductase subunit 6 (subunit J)
MFLNLFFLASALLTVGSALLVLTTKNIMHSCVFLLGSLIGVAGLYATLDADFVAVTQIMVYVGGVVILMLFAVMLTGGKDFVSKAQNLLGLIPAMGNKWSYSVGILVSIVFLLTNIQLISRLGIMSTLKNNGSFGSSVREIGHLFVKEHILAFELSSVLLLGALVGAAIIARPHRHEGQDHD